MGCRATGSVPRGLRLLRVDGVEEAAERGGVGAAGGGGLIDQAAEANKIKPPG